MKVTYGSLKEYTAALEARGDVEGALKGCAALLRADPTDLDARNMLVRLLLASGMRREAVEVMHASAYLAIRGNHPATAIAFTKRLEILGVKTRELWEELVTRYSADSPYLGDVAPRLAPLPDDTPVDGPPQEVDPRELVELATDPTRWPEFPDKHLPMVFLSELGRGEFLQVVEIIHVLSKVSGEYIIREGDIGNAFYILASGRVMVTRMSQGKEKVLLKLSAGALFGEMALVHTGRRTASVIAELPSLLLEFRAEAIRVLASRSRTFAERLKAFTTRRMVENLMNTSALFAPFSRQQRQELLRRFIPVEIDRGEVIIREGEEGRGLYLVLTGRVGVIKGLGTESETMVAELGPSEVFGEISLLRDTPATASVVALDRGTLLYLPKSTFLRLVEVVPQLREHFASLASRRLEDLKKLEHTEGEEEVILI